jgi:hypothetical protein
MKYLAASLKEKLKLPAASREESPEIRMLIYRMRSPTQQQVSEDSEL